MNAMKLKKLTFCRNLIKYHCLPPPSPRPFLFHHNVDGATRWRFNRSFNQLQTLVTRYIICTVQIFVTFVIITAYT